MCANFKLKSGLVQILDRGIFTPLTLCETNVMIKKPVRNRVKLLWFQLVPYVPPTSFADVNYSVYKDTYLFDCGKRNYSS